ncbi:Cullin-4A [Geranomyces variabilis]|nr:Cullin-4A [Geranomyces variabilis]
MSEDIIYVLGLENDCYYVGKSKTPKDRIQQHFSGNGSAWTRLHRPVCVVETLAATTEDSENSLTQRYIRKFGIDRVRGGWFQKPNPSKEEVKMAVPTHAQIRSPKPLHAQIRRPKTLHAGVAGGMDIIKQRAMRVDI